MKTFIRGALCLSLSLLGCETADPVATPLEVGPDVAAEVDSAVDSAATDALDAEAGPSCGTEIVTGSLDDASCKPRADDYVPGSATDGWPACISDDATYHRFAASISTIARVDAFDRIRVLLRFGTDVAPSTTDFVNARLAYTEVEGLESRVSRREDEHYPAAPKACRDLTADEQKLYPDRCVGPVKIQPMLNDAFAAGATGKDPVLNAARVEAALLWFLFVSPYKETRTCATAQADCDSGWAYYTGGDDDRTLEGRGFARYVRARSKQAHDAIWNGLLAVRCWRDLDNPTGLAADLALRDRAVDQLDRALIRGLTVVVRQRLDRLACGGTWESTRILGAVLDREATKRDATKAAALRAELAKVDATTVDVKAAKAALDGLFGCPY